MRKMDKTEFVKIDEKNNVTIRQTARRQALKIEIAALLLKFC